MKRLHPGRPPKIVNLLHVAGKLAQGESLVSVARSLKVSVDTLRDRLRLVGRLAEPRHRVYASNADRQRAYRVRHGQTGKVGRPRKLFDPFAA